MKQVIRTAEVVINGSGMLGSFMMVIMMLMSVSDIIFRYFFKIAIMGAYEYSIMLLTGVAFLGFGSCTLHGNHVTVDLLVGVLPSKVNKFFSHLDNYLTMVVAALVVIRSISQAFIIRDMNLVFPITGIARHPFLIITAYGYFLLFMAVIIKQFVYKEKLG